MTALDLDDIQGLVLRGYRLAAGSYTFLRIADAAGARSWLADLLGHVTTAAPWEAKPTSTVNVAISATGLTALGLPEPLLTSFPKPFRQGMAARADILGDSGDSAPQHWQDGLGGPDVHILVMLATSDGESLRQRETWLDGTLGPLELVSRQQVAALPSGAEHFGYADGFSQPDVEGLGSPVRTAQSGVDGEGGWRPIKAGEFVLGYPDEEGVLPVAPQPAQLASGGSFLVYRKLRQDVLGFRDMLAQHSGRYPGGAELLAAKIVGRWRNGSPLVLSPSKPDPALAADFDRNNSFDYGGDPDGYRCPIGSHIRRANPRNSLRFSGKLVNRHRLIRRGLPYGPALGPGAPDDGVERGVIFLCFQTDLGRQFEFVQSQWMNDGNPLRLGDDRDPLAGGPGTPGKLTIQGEPPYFLHPLSSMVQTRGGEYFFTPGIGGLRYLCALESPASAAVQDHAEGDAP